MATNFWTQLKQPIIALAPMEGVTDSAFRQLCREQGAAVAYTEFISSDAIAHRGRTALAKMDFDPAEQPVVCQIFGHDIEAFAKAAKEVEARGFSGIDINFGCPARKVVGHGSGAALLRKPAYCRALIESVLGSVSIPLSIKVRSSIRKRSKEEDPGCQERYTALDLVEAIEDLPVSTIMIHGRSYEMGHSGEVDTEMIQAVKQRFKGLVLANGGIKTPEDTKRMLEQTGADGVGIARGSQGQAWIFRQTRQYLESGSYDPISWPEIRALMLRHAELLYERKGRRGMFEIRKHLTWYIRGIEGASALRQKLVQVESVEQIEKILPQEVTAVEK
ncbi:MAG: tRNA-dihydrouridine synthase [Candidatus Nomurabacteria bacterium]|nr:MAG: tRNA-dihydrouridine synthase [Candidatus Nomurabacteria bacterium]